MTTHAVRWTIQKIQARLTLIEPLVYRRRSALAPFRYRAWTDALEALPVGVEAADADWERLEPPVYWGARRTAFILRTRVSVPADWPAEGGALALYLPLGPGGDFSHPEALAYFDGTPLAACDRHHQEIPVPATWRDGQAHTLALHGWTGLVAPNHQPLMQPCALVQIDAPTRAFIALARVTLGTAQSLPKDNPARGLLLTALETAFRRLDTREPFGEAFYASVPAAHAALDEGVGGAGPALDVTVFAAGHAHIDVAWQWTLDQTRRKAGRTFHTVERLMEQFPGYHFTQSQPQLYEFVRQDYPALFAAIQERVAEGRWEPIGGMWVEADCNLTGAEALARQFLLGRAFFREHFGPQAETPVLWLPDVFGYAWSLPQLIKQAGLEFFFTIKIGWSQYNRLPYDSFWWQGLDGTRVLTHFGTTPDGEGETSTYNADASPRQLYRTWTNFQQKELSGARQAPPLLMAYGFGDGGGGPTRAMLENLEALREFPGQPRARSGKVGEFFRELRDQSGAVLPVWNGELYLEYHRGTYTTQGRNKRANRQSEFLLHDAEFLACLAQWQAPGFAYPAEALRAAWQLVCLNQFHDIIPGSSIGPVYVESQRQYAEIRQRADTAREAALAALAAPLGGDVLVINPTSFTRRDLAFLPGEDAAAWNLRRRADGRPVAVQSAQGGAWLAVGELPPYSVTILDGALESPGHAAPAGVMATPTLLENDTLRAEFNAAGDLVRVYDKAARREVLAPGAVANQLQAFEDRPMNWDAWDIDSFYDDKVWLAEPAEAVRVIEAGPLRATLEIRRRVLNSAVVQRISLARHSPRLDFATTVDWRERHILLKVAFPVEVFSPVATYEIQWGNVQRPTHRNTSWDWARFETCAHKWVDLSEGGYGVSLLNDCKYGHDLRDNVIRLSLLRSPTDPDPQADQGEHQFTYSLYPHAGPWDSRTAAEAYALNDPLIVRRGSGAVRAVQPAPLIQVDAAHVILETVKAAEDGRGLIVRLYEHQRQRGPVTLTAGFNIRAAWRTNLLEENQSPVEVDGRQVTLALRPFEIVTLRLLPDEVS